MPHFNVEAETKPSDVGWVVSSGQPQSLEVRLWIGTRFVTRSFPATSFEKGINSQIDNRGMERTLSVTNIGESKMKRHITTLSIITGLLFVTTASADNNLKKALLAQEKKVIDAIQRNDQKTLKAMLGQQPFSVNDDGTRRTAREVIEVLKNVKMTSYKISEVEAVPVGKNGGVLSYKYVWSGTENGRSYTNAPVRATSVWEQRNGKWMSVFYQETPIRK